MQPDFSKDLAKRLYDLLLTARIIPLAEVGVDDGDRKSFPRFSHDNVNIWIRRSPDYKAVRGWVIFDFSSNATFRASFVRFAAHSVIEAPDGACGISPDGTHRSRIHLSAILAATRISISSEPTACCMSITIFSGAGQSDCRRSDRYTAGSLKGSTRAI